MYELKHEWYCKLLVKLELIDRGEMLLAEYIEKVKQRIQDYENEKYLNVLYLMELHPDITPQDAVLLLKYCKENTIKLKSCYGDGSKMIEAWRASKQTPLIDGIPRTSG